MESDKYFLRFLSWIAGVVSAGVFLSLALVVAIDPYRIYGLLDVPGFNHVKPRPERFQEQIKLTGARMLDANALIMGNSRAEIGFNPEYPFFSEHGLAAYNLAVPGTKIQTPGRQLDYLYGVGHKPAVIILGLDFLDFLVDPASSTIASAPEKTRNQVDELRWQFDAAFSLSSVSDAITTLGIQRRADAKTISDKGFNPLLEYTKYARDEGYYSLFQQRAAEYAKSFSRMPRSLVKADSGSSQELNVLRKILAKASDHQTELHLIIYPYHAQMLALFEQAGLWSAFDQWKIMLVHEVAAAKRLRSNARITVWDFSGYSTVQCESIPGKTNKEQTTKWYWEAGHFKQELGNLMLARIFDDAPAQPTGFGIVVPLTSSTLQGNRKRIEHERASCMNAHPELFNDAAMLLNDVRKRQS